MAHLIYNIRKANLLKSPLIAVVTGSGRIVKASVSAGADLIIALNAGLYRNMGFGSLAAFMPYGNANEQTEELLKTHILAHSGSPPVVAGRSEERRVGKESGSTFSSRGAQY